MNPELRNMIIAGVQDGSIVPYLGAGVLADVRETGEGPNKGRAIPADSDSLILAMNDGRPMSPKLMYEFPRAAMNVELKKGRGAVTRFLVRTYGETQWSRGAVHDWLKEICPPYVIDINRDTQLLDSYANCAHLLVVGVARIGGTDYRFKLYHFDGSTYHGVTLEQANGLYDSQQLPVLFKPMGSPRPEANFIASDADYVDYITELMGGFAVPSFVKKMRLGKRYLLLGLRLQRDTERMVLADLIYGAAPADTHPSGWALIPGATDKERRFCAKYGISVIDASVFDLLAGTGQSLAA